jgi:catechol 2,3-dioxygenase-like lactoylglutathione lyase family enzyme
MIIGLHHVQLAAPAGSEPELRAFYAGVLGLEEVAKPAEPAKRGGAWFRGQGVEVHLGIEDDFRPAAKAHPAFLVDDLDALVAKLPGAVPGAAFGGFRRVHVSDPVGNRIELMQRA